MPSPSFDQNPAPSGRGGLIAWMIISQGLFVASLYPWIGWLWFMSLFDSISPAGFVLGYLWYPVLSLIYIIVAWVKFAKGDDDSVMYWTSLPLMLAFPQLCIVLMSLN